MADILHDLAIKAPLAKVFPSIATPSGLDAWWTKKSSGKPALNEEFVLWFGPEYDWRAVVSKYVPQKAFELRMTKSDGDWQGTCVGFTLEEKKDKVQVKFYHVGWPSVNDHYRVSTYCWAMYLRLLKLYVEKGEVVRYEDRLEV